MMNIVYNNKINNFGHLFFGNSFKRKKNLSSLNDFEKSDVFERENKINMETGENKYNNENGKFNTDMTVLRLQNKIKCLPLVMDRLMYSLLLYLQSKKDTDEFVSGVLKDSPIVIKRAELGEDAEEYAKNYKSELNAISSITSACSEYASKEIDKKEMDAKLKDVVAFYLEDKSQRKRHFTA